VTLSAALSRSSVSRKLWGLLIVASTLPLIAATVVQVRTQRADGAASATALLRARADEVAGKIDAFNVALQDAAERTAAAPSIRAFVVADAAQRERARADVDGYLAHFVTVDARLRGVGVTDREGVVVAATEAPLVGRSYAFRGYLKRALAGVANTSEVYVAVPEVGSTASVAYAAPIRSREGAVIGAFVIWARADALWRVVRSGNGRAGAGSFSVLVDEFGVRIAHSASDDEVFRPVGPIDEPTLRTLETERRFGDRTRALLAAPSPAPEEHLRARSAILDRAPFRNFSPFNDAWNLAVAKRLESVGWTLFYMVPESTIGAVVDASTRSSVAAGAAFTALALVAGAVIIRRFVAPIRRLDAVAKALGRGDRTARADVESNDELGDLARRLNEMADALAAERDGLERKVRERTQELDRFFSLSNGLLAIAGKDGRFRRLNPSWSRLFGHPEAELLARPYLDFVHPEDCEATVREAERLAMGSEVITFENRYRCADGSYRRLAWSCSPLVEGDAIYAMAFDVTERRRAEEALVRANDELKAQADELRAQADELRAQADELEAQQEQLRRKGREIEEANRLKSQFLANMSHELRTPLNAVIGFSDLLLEGTAGPMNEKQARFAADILASGRHLLGLINDILDLSKIEAGKTTLSLGPVEPADAISDAIGPVTPLARKKRITIRVRPPVGVPLVRADAAKLQQVLLNLLSNAVKFSPEGAAVDVSAEAAGAYVRFRIADEGAGIDEAILPRLFQPFVQGEGALSRKHQGTGLGLAISKRIIELHQGAIEVKSVPGKGSTFTFTIPCEAAAATEAGAATAGRPAPDGGRARPLILVVEDDPAARRLLREYLETAGYDVAETDGARDAVERTEALRPVAVILDLRLGANGDGLTVLVELKRRPSTAAIPVVIQSVSGDRIHGLTLGAADYFVKPLERGALVARLRDLIEPPSGDGPPTVLVIDDDPRVGELLSETLEPAGFRTLRAATGREGIETAVRERPQLTFVDIGLPDISGFEVVEALSRDERTRHRPVVVLTAMDLSDAQRARLKASALALAEKGDLTRDALLATVRRAIDRSPAPAAGPAAPPATEAAPRPGILVVDDHDLNRELARTLLELNGHRVILADGGARAIETARRERPALILLDLAMPEVDGFQVARALRADPATAAIPLVALTALAMRGDEERAREAGFDGYLTKPIDRKALAATVARWIKPQIV